MLDDPEIMKIIRVQTLVNAKMFKGKPNPKAIIGKLMGQHPNLRPHAKELGPVIAKLVSEISSMRLDDIDAELKKIAPDAVQTVKKKKAEKVKKRIEKKKGLEDIPSAIDGKFVVRYAPDPSKYPHIGQGMNFLINRMYADKYHGKVVLRFDDTNPTIVRAKYFDAIKDGLLWLGCTWDTEIRASQFLDEFYKLAEDWIAKKWMYVCLCEGDKLSKGRENGVACEHRDDDNSAQLFRDMLDNKFKAGQATVRLMGDMSSDNNVMRDPVMFRIVTDKHEMLDKFYPVFPTYDFESAYLDWKMGITHIIRSGEFGTMRQEMQIFIIEKLGGKAPEFKSFGRFNIQGCPTKGRVIRELVETQVVEGWDDIRLITLAGLRHRGVHPHTPRLLIQEAGLTPKNTNIAWSTFEKKSKELLEPNAKRLYFVENPVKLTVTGVDKREVNMPYHPDHKEYGVRTVIVENTIYLSKNDTATLRVGDTVRLKDLYNVKISYKGRSLRAEFAGDDLIPKVKKIQWVVDGVRGTLRVPDLLEKQKGKINEASMSEISGLFESSISNITADEVIQLERVGYARVFVSDEITGHLVHK